jgi:hypothetical protein
VVFVSHEYILATKAFFLSYVCFMRATAVGVARFLA